VLQRYDGIAESTYKEQRVAKDKKKEKKAGKKDKKAKKGHDISALLSSKPAKAATKKVKEWS
jgi:hypothetical protein